MVAGIRVELSCGDLGGSASEDATEGFEFFAWDADLGLVEAESADLKVLAFGGRSGVDFVGMPTKASVFDGGFDLLKEGFGEIGLGGEGEIVGISGVCDGYVVFLEVSKEVFVEGEAGEIEQITGCGRTLGEFVFVRREIGDQADHIVAQFAWTTQTEFFEQCAEADLHDVLDAGCTDGRESIFEIEVEQVSCAEVGLCVGDDGSAWNKAMRGDRDGHVIEESIKDAFLNGFEFAFGGADLAGFAVAFGDLPFVVAESALGELLGKSDVGGGKVEPLGKKRDGVLCFDGSGGGGCERGCDHFGFIGEFACFSVALVGVFDRGGELFAVDLFEEGDDPANLAASFDLGAWVGDLDAAFKGFLAAFDQQGIGFESSKAQGHAANDGVFVLCVDESRFSAMEAEVVFDHREFEFLLDICGDRRRRRDGDIVDVSGITESKFFVLIDDLKDLAIHFKASEVEQVTRCGRTLGECVDSACALGRGFGLAHGGERGEKVQCFVEWRRPIVQGFGVRKWAKLTEEWFHVASKDPVDAWEPNRWKGVAQVHHQELLCIGEVVHGVGNDGTPGNSTMCGIGDRDGIE